MANASLALADAFVWWSKYKALDEEISLIPGGFFACMWLLVLYSVIRASVEIVVALKRHSGGGEADPRLKEIADGLSNHQIDSHGGILQYAAIMALMNKPESPEAEFLFRAVRANLLNATAGNNVPGTEILPGGSVTCLSQSE